MEDTESVRSDGSGVAAAALAICFGEDTEEPSCMIAAFSALGVDLLSIALIVIHCFVGSVL